MLRAALKKMADKENQSKLPQSEREQNRKKAKTHGSRLHRLWHELKRRGVIKVSLAYLAFAWLIIQVTSILISAFGGTGWIMQAVIIAFTVGLPIVISLSWTYEWTSEGIQVDEGESKPTAVSHVHGRKLELTIIGLLVLAVSALLVERFISSDSGDRLANSIAVLPFDNISGNPDKEYFVDGMTDTLITKLSQISSLRVKARMSVMKFKNSELDLPKIAAALGVKAILSGSAIYDKGRVRITTRLIDVETDRHLWSKSYDRELEDILALQSEVALNVAKNVAIALSPEEETRLLSTRKVNRESYEAFLRGKYYVNTMTLDGFEKGIAYFNEAIELDPADPLAWAGLAYGQITILHSPLFLEGVNWRSAQAAALRALDLDPYLAEAWSVLADIRSYFEGDYIGAEKAFIRANELNPSLASNHFHYAWYLALMGRVDEAIEEHLKAEKLDPLTPHYFAYTGGLYIYQGKYDEAMAKVEEAAAINPDGVAVLFIKGLIYLKRGMTAEAIATHERMAELYPIANWILGTTYIIAGRTDEALEILKNVELATTGSIRGWAQQGSAQMHIALGNRDEAVHWLSQEPGHAWRPWLIHSPYTSSVLEDHSGYMDLVNKKPLPPDAVPIKHSLFFLDL